MKLTYLIVIYVGVLSLQYIEAQTETTITHEVKVQDIPGRICSLKLLAVVEGNGSSVPPKPVYLKTCRDVLPGENITG